MASQDHITTRLPALKARVAALRERLDRHAPPQARAALLTAYAEALAVRPIFEREAHDSPRYRAAFQVEQRLRGLVKAAMEGPTPTDREGLSVLALAAAFHAEGMARSHWDNGHELVVTARALLLATGTALPADFAGFGDEEWYGAREDALLASPGRLPVSAGIAAAA